MNFFNITHKEIEAILLAYLQDPFPPFTVGKYRVNDLIVSDNSINIRMNTAYVIIGLVLHYDEQMVELVYPERVINKRLLSLESLALTREILDYHRRKHDDPDWMETFVQHRRYRIIERLLVA